MHMNQLKTIARTAKLTAGFAPAIALTTYGYIAMLDIVVMAGITLIASALAYNMRGVYAHLSAPAPEAPQVPKTPSTPRFTNKQLASLTSEAIALALDGYSVIENSDKILFFKAGQPTLLLNKDGLKETDEYVSVRMKSRARAQVRDEAPLPEEPPYFPEAPAPYGE